MRVPKVWWMHIMYLLVILGLGWHALNTPGSVSVQRWEWGTPLAASTSCDVPELNDRTLWISLKPTGEPIAGHWVRSATSLGPSDNYDVQTNENGFAKLYNGDVTTHFQFGEDMIPSDGVKIILAIVDP